MYHREKAKLYAQKWALKRNPLYFDFENIGGDCTNFISQCLFAGGIKFDYNNYGWYYHSLSVRSPSWTGVDEFYSFSLNNKYLTGPQIVNSTFEHMQIGDIVQLKTHDKWTHSLFITNIFLPINLQNIFVCSHSFDALNKSLGLYNFDNIRFLKIIN